MKIPAHVNIEAFLRMIDSCAGTVELVSTEGDCLNLKSKLCQFVSMAKLFNNDTYIKELDLKLSEPSDFQKIMAFVMYGD